MVLPEERLKNDAVGCDAEIEMVPFLHGDVVGDGNDTKLSSIAPADDILRIGSITEETVKSAASPRHWTPSCCARKLRSLRKLLFNQTKTMFFESILDATTTFTPLHQDEYEDPREIKSVRINRIKANQSRLTVLSNLSERSKQSGFGQLHKE